jgi:hypothetical protein
MPETLLSPSKIILYGRKVLDLQILQQVQVPNPNPPPENLDVDLHPQGLGSNDHLREQLTDQGAGRPAPILARIYAFSFEGHSWDLYKPAIFLVHGDGEPAEPVKPANRAGRAPATADETGVAAQSYTYSDDMRIWTYEKDDLSLRMDVEAGSFEEILLESVLKVEAQRTAGARVDTPGARVDLAGARADVAGARVRGNRGGWSD